MALVDIKDLHVSFRHHDGVAAPLLAALLLAALFGDGLRVALDPTMKG